MRRTHPTILQSRLRSLTLYYTFEGKAHDYIPDFIAKVDDGRGDEDLLNLIIEVSGEKREDKVSKVETVKNIWVPAVNNVGEFGRWAVCEVIDQFHGMRTIRGVVT